MTAIEKAIRTLQKAVRNHFGPNVTSDCGENTLVVAPDNVRLWNENCKIEGRGPVRIATVLRRKRRKTA